MGDSRLRRRRGTNGSLSVLSLEVRVLSPTSLVSIRNDADRYVVHVIGCLQGLYDFTKNNRTPLSHFLRLLALSMSLITLPALFASLEIYQVNEGGKRNI